MKDDLLMSGASPELLARISQLKSDLTKSKAPDLLAHASAETTEALQTVEQIEMLMQLGLVLEASKLIDEMIHSAEEQ
jgi:hypothetical protein